MTDRLTRSALLPTLLAVLALVACKLPVAISQVLVQQTPTLTPTPIRTASATLSPVAATEYPAPELGTSYPGPLLETPYPGFGATPYPQGGESSPYPGLQEATAYPGLLQLTPSPTSVAGMNTPGSSSLTPTATRTLAVTPTSTQPSPGEGGYPPPYPPADSPYPGSGEYPPPDAYPALGADLTSTPPGALAATPESTLTPGASPIAPIPFQTPTPPPSITPTPFLTPTPTLTATPTRTPTPIPPPPWVNSRLRASDPRAVRLASGRVQLVMFFAFWSGPSQAMAPIVHGLQAEYRDRIIFTYLDIDDPATRLFQSQLKFRVEPHFFLLDPQGRILRQWIGYATPAQFRQAFQEALAR